MSGINSFITSFCGGCILLGFLYMLCPSGSMSASVKYVFCLCFVCSVLVAVISIPSPDFSSFDKAKSNDILTEENAAVTAQLMFGEALKQKNINYREIVVNTNKLADNSIIISKVTVYSNCSAQEIIATIDSKDYEVVVINE